MTNLIIIHWILLIVGSFSAVVLLLRILIGVLSSFITGKVAGKEISTASMWWNLFESIAFFYVVFLLLETYFK